ncbi:alkaline phosphatase D family protein [Cyclobacterium sp.]|uniref:alkaline phosphatase D family protein n=1 Tax=Cyclobacterium sp. TaxID=1966343 RepID=UPI0019BBED09|nr:alkaline phosphatase D family protein [Cyclobacterium sp.]MBD3630305.1 alkaline phosphatase D family protein [Cyclobacterium sp.]
MNKANRRGFFKKTGLSLLSLIVTPKVISQPIQKLLDLISRTNTGVYFTNGFKIAEVGKESAMLWTRLCGQEFPQPLRHQRQEKVFRHPIDFDEDQPVSEMDGAVSGSAGLVRAKVSTKSGRSVFNSSWQAAEEADDFTVKIPVKGLQPNTAYQVDWEAKAVDNNTIRKEIGSFTTPPSDTEPAPVFFTTSTCQYFWSFDDERRGFQTYDSMRRLEPDFFIHTGDYIYYDKPGPLAKNLEKARHKWHAMDGWLSLRDFYKEVPVYMVKDDHDLLKDDMYRGKGPYGDLTFDDGLKLWYENVPIEGKPYRTLRWGKDLQVWLVEGREYRSENTMEDGPEKTIWGDEQKEWFQESVEASDATFKILFTATPVVGPDRENKTDNHANESFRHEGEWLRNFLSGQPNMYVVNGDRHWQYVSKDKETGLMEFGSGPVSDCHSQGWKEGDVRPEHRFLRLKGGFLSIRVHRNAQTPEILFEHRDVLGKVVNEERFEG